MSVSRGGRRSEQPLGEQARNLLAIARVAALGYANGMGIPWLLALKAIPWDTILANAPSILRSADTLVSKTTARPAAASRVDVQALADRIAALEQRDSETAELLTRVTAQVAALTTASKVLEARARWLFVAAVAAVVMAAFAGIAVLAR